MVKAKTHLVGFVIGGRNETAFNNVDREYCILDLSDCTPTADDRIKQSDVITRLKSELNITVAATHISYMSTKTERCGDEKWGLVAHHIYYISMCTGNAPKSINL